MSTEPRPRKKTRPVDTINVGSFSAEELRTAINNRIDEGQTGYRMAPLEGGRVYKALKGLEHSSSLSSDDVASAIRVEMLTHTGYELSPEGLQAIYRDLQQLHRSRSSSTRPGFK